MAALVIPVPEADWLVRGRDRFTTNVGAHLLLAQIPYERLRPGDIDVLIELFGDVVPFSFDLEAVCELPGGEVYLAPEPGAPVRRLAHALTGRFPRHPLGTLGEAVPRVTVPLRDGETVDDVTALVAAHPPMRGHASEALLVSTDEGRLLAEFAFGTTAA